jgi:ribonuclease HII
VRLIAGLDEAGRGALAGPVYAAAVILRPDRVIPGLNDSKRLTAVAREHAALAIRAQALACAVAHAEAEEVDRLNVLQASLLAMQRAVAALPVRPGLALVDGLQVPRLHCKAQAVVNGDALHPCIMAASILAKVARDGAMRELEQNFPGYGFATHKGYPTAAHRAALLHLGPCSAHRRSYAPVARQIALLAR